MSPRVAFWASGALSGVVLAAAVPAELFPGARPTLFGSAFLGLGLCGEWVDARRARRRAEVAATRRDARAADGRVDLLRLSRFDGEPNPFDPRFRRFTPAGDGRRDPDGRDSPRSALGAGCPPLLGRVVVASLFVGRDGRSWSDGELAEAHQAIFRAGVWLEREARRYGAAINLEVADVYFVADDDEPDDVMLGFVAQGDEVGPFEERAVTKALRRATRAAHQLGFPAAPDLFRAVEDHAAADALVWLLHPREASRSFAIPTDERAPGGVSLAVCYPREASFPEPLRGPARVDPVTVVHELLHLFGATDKYGRPLSTYGPRAVTPREVMRLHEERLSRLRIDPVTAAEIGWNPNQARRETTDGRRDP